jgi:CubicO group peptidase (beta-lactamase class C family)
MKTFRTSLLLLVAIAGAASGAENSLPPVEPRAIDALFAAWDKADSPGAALAVMQDGKIIYEHGYGRANLEHGVPITPETAFYVGSVSKQFTAASVALLAQRGLVSLDADVRTYVPELPDYGSRITVRHLIHHTSGLRDYLALRELAGAPADGVFGNDEALALICRQKALNFAPGTRYLYSNSGYFLLSLIVQRTSGKSLRDFAAENLFAPLGMRTAQYRDDHALVIAHRADGYTPRPGGGYRLSNPNFDVVGAGGLFLTVRDFLTWDENFYHPKIGGEAWSAQLQTPGKLNDGRPLTYAFGLIVATYRGLPVVEHNGAYGGFRAHVMRFPQQHFSIVCFTNLATMTPGDLARRVADLYLGSAMEPAPTKPASTATIASGSATPAAAPAPKARASADATAPAGSDFAGEYFSEELQVVYKLSQDDGGWSLERPHRLRLQPSGRDAVRYGTTTLSFQRDANGAVIAFTLDASGARGIEFVRR